VQQKCELDAHPRQPQPQQGRLGCLEAMTTHKGGTTI